MSRALNRLETIGATIVATGLIGNGWAWNLLINNVCVVLGGFILGALVSHVIETDGDTK